MKNNSGLIGVIHGAGLHDLLIGCICDLDFMVGVWHGSRSSRRVMNVLDRNRDRLLSSSVATFMTDDSVRPHEGHRMICITCRDFINVVDRYYSKSLSNVEHDASQYHLSVCRHCSDYLKTYSDTIRLVRSARMSKKDHDIGDDGHASVESGDRERWIQAILTVQRSNGNTA